MFKIDSGNAPTGAQCTCPQGSATAPAALPTPCQHAHCALGWWGPAHLFATHPLAHPAQPGLHLAALRPPGAHNRRPPAERCPPHPTIVIREHCSPQPTLQSGLRPVCSCSISPALPSAGSCSCISAVLRRYAAARASPGWQLAAARRALNSSCSPCGFFQQRASHKERPLFLKVWAARIVASSVIQRGQRGIFTKLVQPR